MPSCTWLAGRCSTGVVLDLALHDLLGARNYFAGLASGLGWVIPDGPAWAAAHAAFGLALVLAAFAGIALSRRQAGRVATSASVLGALAILAPGSTE